MSSPDHQISILKDIVFPLANFFMFVGVLFYFLREPLKKFVRGRSEDVQGKLSQAKEAFERENKKYLDAKQKLDQVETEKDELIRQTQEDMKVFKQKSTEEIQRQLDRMKNDNDQRIAEEIRKATVFLKAQAAQNVIEETQKSLEKKLNDKSQKILVDDYIENISVAYSAEGKGKDVSNKGKTIRQSAR